MTFLASATLENNALGLELISLSNKVSTLCFKVWYPSSLFINILSLFKYITYSNAATIVILDWTKLLFTNL